MKRDFVLLKGFHLRLHNHKKKMNAENKQRRDHDDKQAHITCSNLYRQQDCKYNLNRERTKSEITKEQGRNKERRICALTMIPMLAVKTTFVGKRARFWKVRRNFHIFNTQTCCNNGLVMRTRRKSRTLR